MSFEHTKLLRVKLDFVDGAINVGRLASSEGRIYFEFDSSFLDKSLNISPFQLPLKPGVSMSDATFDGLFGVFNDSLPDGWGRLLLDRAVSARGIPHQKLGPLDRLAHVGAAGMGALTYEPETNDLEASQDHLSLDRIDAEVHEILAGDSVDVIKRLLELGGSSAGARPKILVGYDQRDNRIVSGQLDLKDGFEPWLIKFGSSLDQKDIGNIEYAYALMAKEAGVEMPETKLFSDQSSKAYFGVKRFDRVGSTRLHVHTVSGLLHADHRIPSLDYEGILRCTLALNRDVREVAKVFRLAAFNVLSHNRDDHSKNFSFIMSETGSWSFAPAYDLTFSYGPGGEHSTTVMGEGRAPGTEQLKSLARKFQLKDGNKIIEEVRDAISKWRTLATTADVSKRSSNLIATELAKIHREK